MKMQFNVKISNTDDGKFRIDTVTNPTTNGFGNSWSHMHTFDTLEEAGQAVGEEFIYQYNQKLEDEEKPTITCELNDDGTCTVALNELALLNLDVDLDNIGSIRTDSAELIELRRLIQGQARLSKYRRPRD